ncbi:cytochrome P450 [Talaromyces proteolyticus]|uniref:Cytochrome P450 n=1 Tax=Talaromyces proteolyticus TaxID=1131652 RepID=A0AAD4PVU1_9EURO|nr:cytochrome P450 [Talaromyces proteolyticus]KAH8691177.1 cytochrome P450 [Talaromyces proteolyticus]
MGVCKSSLLPHIDTLAGIGFVILTISFLHRIFFSRSTFPMISGRRLFEIGHKNAQERFVSDAYNIIKSGFAKSADGFRLITDNGCKLALAPKYANEIRNIESLSFSDFIAREFHAHIPGFEPFRRATMNHQLFQEVVRTHLTQALEWHTLVLKPSVIQLIARLSSRVFLGDRICRNTDWLRIAINYMLDAHLAAASLRQWPKLMRPLVARFHPLCRKIRGELQEAREIITTVLQARQDLKATAMRSGQAIPQYNDAIEWMEGCAKGCVYDPAAAQLNLSTVALHTTSDLLTQVIYNLCGRDDLICALREEIITAIREEGWKSTTLYKLKLMDSTIKESQRLKPIGIIAMNRIASNDVQLSDGTRIPRGTTLFVSNDRMWDPTFHTDPETFDAYRFLKMRQVPGHETSAQLVSLSPNHLGFGLGKHACPGRFFASNEMKIALCHILIKYDFKLQDGCVPQIIKHGVSLSSDPHIKIAIKRRQEEIFLDERME